MISSFVVDSIIILFNSESNYVGYPVSYICMPNATTVTLYISLIIVIILILNGKELNDQYKVLLMSLLCVETIHFENLSPSRRLRVDYKLRINDRMSHVLIRY